MEWCFGVDLTEIKGFACLLSINRAAGVLALSPILEKFSPVYALHIRAALTAITDYFLRPRGSSSGSFFSLLLIALSFA